jgi:hypothetical protein
MLYNARVCTHPESASHCEIMMKFSSGYWYCQCAYTINVLIPLSHAIRIALTKSNVSRVRCKSVARFLKYQGFDARFNRVLS